MPLPIVAGEFRVVGEPALSFSPAGKQFCRLTLVCNSRKQVDGEWVDDKSLWLYGTAFGRMAEHVAESVTDKMLVVVSGSIYTNEYENREGQKVRSTNININEIGPSLRWNTAQVAESTQSSSRPAQSREQANPWGGGQQSSQQANPWGQSGDEPPY